MPQKIVHPLAPIADEESRVLILGTMPSPKSRERGFYYGHPQNRFWRVLALLFGEEPPTTEEDRTALLKGHRIALWDTLFSCTIEGASDASIRDPVPNDVAGLLKTFPGIRAVFTTGQTAKRFYDRLILPQTGREATVLPSPSPANARMSLSDLLEAYRVLLPPLEEEPENGNLS